MICCSFLFFLCNGFFFFPVRMISVEFRILTEEYHPCLKRHGYGTIENELLLKFPFYFTQKKKKKKTQITDITKQNSYHPD